MMDCAQPLWFFLEDDNLVIDPAKGVVAAVQGDRYDGYLLASAHRMFAALDNLDTIAGELAAAAEHNDQDELADLLEELKIARGEAALAIRLASGAREH
jgi:ABC-type lipopolysaccharide export system ATPase subunit